MNVDSPTIDEENKKKEDSQVLETFYNTFQLKGENLVAGTNKNTFDFFYIQSNSNFLHDSFLFSFSELLYQPKYTYPLFLLFFFQFMHVLCGTKFQQQVLCISPRTIFVGHL
jgi:hypothetical protein